MPRHSKACGYSAALRIAKIFKDSGWEVALQVFAGHDWIIPSVERRYRKERKNLREELKSSLDELEQFSRSRAKAEGIGIIEVAEVQDDNPRFKRYKHLKGILKRIEPVGRSELGFRKPTFPQKIRERGRTATSDYFRSVGTTPQRIHLAVEDARIRRASALFLSEEATEKTKAGTWGAGVILTTEATPYEEEHGGMLGEENDNISANYVIQGQEETSPN